MTTEEHNKVPIGTHFWGYDTTNPKTGHSKQLYVFLKEGNGSYDYFIAGNWEGGTHYIDIDFIEEIKKPNL